MELNTFIEKYKGWLASTGVTAVPEITKAEHTPAVGYVPATYLDWKNSIGSLLRQGADVLATQDSPENGLAEVRAFFSLPKLEGNTAEMWKRYLNPPAEVVPTIPKMGKQVPTEHVAAFAPGGRVDPSRKYFYQGGLDIPDGGLHREGGKMFLSVAPNPFSRWLLEL